MQYTLSLAGGIRHFYFWRMLLAKFLRLLWQEGSYYATGPDFNARREAALARWQGPRPAGGRKPPLRIHPRFRPLVTQLASIKHAAKPHPRHLWLPASDLAYIRMPRAGSTAVAAAILEKRFPATGIDHLAPEDINFLADVWLNEREMPPAPRYFTIVRHPLARLLSVYRALFEKPGAEDFIYGEYLFGILHQELSFSEFVRRIEMIPNRLKDPHFRPQTELLAWYRRRKIPVQILRFEEPDQVAEFLRPYGLEWNPPRPAASSSDYYDAEAMARAARIFRSDMTAFGYKSARF